MHAKIESVKDRLTAMEIRCLRVIATVRNKLAHEETFRVEDVPPDFLLLCGELLNRLQFRDVDTDIQPTDWNRVNGQAVTDLPRVPENAAAPCLANQNTSQNLPTSSAVEKVEQVRPKSPQSDFEYQNIADLDLEKVALLANAGNASAQYELATRVFDFWYFEAVEFFQKETCEEERALYATTWLHKSAEQGLVIAQHELGLIYLGHDYRTEFGKYIQPDLSMARQWLTKAAEQGHLEAQVDLGCLLYDWRDPNFDYDEGEFHERDDDERTRQEEGRSWLRTAAEKGHGEALRILVEIFFWHDPDIADEKKYEETIYKESTSVVSQDG